MLTGEKRFVGETLPSLLWKIVREEPPPALRFNPTLPADATSILGKALAKLAADRYETCVDFAEALSKACEKRPGWRPMGRGDSQNLPTLATTLADTGYRPAPNATPGAVPVSVAVPAPAIAAPAEAPPKTEPRLAPLPPLPHPPPKSRA